MKDVMLMTVSQSCQAVKKDSLDISRRQCDLWVINHLFEIRTTILKNNMKILSFIKYIVHLFFYKAGEGVYFDDVLLVRFLQDLDFSNTTTIDAIIFSINSLTDDSLVGNVFVSCLIFL